MRPWDDVDRYEFADATGRRRTRVGGRLHRRNVAAHNRGDVARADFLPQPTSVTFAVFTMASAASIIATSPFVSTIPSASPTPISFAGCLSGRAGALAGPEGPAPPIARRA